MFFANQSLSETLADHPSPTAPPLDISWPPPYSLRISTRAKRIFVQVSQKRGLEVILPKRKRAYSDSDILSVLQEHGPWLKKHLLHWQQEQQRKEQQPLLPNTLHFPAFEKEIQVFYHASPSQQVRIRITPFCPLHLNLTGAVHDVPKVLSCLKKNLYCEAAQLLIPRLQAFSQKIELPFSQASIRSQTSLWGSCTTTKKISLNAKLLFLPQELLDYVLLHELCHTRYMNHSQKFWNLLKQFDPFCLQHRSMLKNASLHLPRWVEYF